MSGLTSNCLKIAAAVQSHESTARQVVDQALASADRHQEQWRAFIRITPDLARQQAERVDQRLARGQRLPLAGVPFAVKDLFDVKGLPTTSGSPAFQNSQAKADATVVQRLVSAGAVLIGKLNMAECAFNFTGENPTFGDCKNPWDPQRIAGGSSSGSAVAVALGICPLTLGSDTGGSIRLPASLCGIVGLKPTYGRVSRAGVAPLSWSMDHAGPLTRTAEEAALVLEVIAGHDPRDGTSSRRPVASYRRELAKPMQGLKLGLPKRWFFDSVAPEVETATRTAIAQLAASGAEIVDVDLPHLEEILGAHRAIIFSEAASHHQPWIAERGELYSDDIRVLLEAGLLLPAVDYLKAQRLRSVVRAAWKKVFQMVDCLVTPSSPIVATRFGQQTAELPGGEKPLVRAFLDPSLPFNFSGHPAASVPCGFSPDGLPIGLQLVGRPFDERLILRTAYQYQRQTDWHRRQPLLP